MICHPKISISRLRRLLIAACILSLALVGLGTSAKNCSADDDWREQWYGKLFRIKCEGEEIVRVRESFFASSLTCVPKSRYKELNVERCHWMVFPISEDVVFIVDYETGFLLGSNSTDRINNRTGRARVRMVDYRPPSSTATYHLNKSFQVFCLKKTGKKGSNNVYTIQDVGGFYLDAYCNTKSNKEKFFKMFFRGDEDESIKPSQRRREFEFEEVGNHPKVVPYKQFTKQSKIESVEVPTMDSVINASGPKDGKKELTGIKVLPYFLTHEPKDVRCRAGIGTGGSGWPYVDRNGNQSNISSKKYIEKQYRERIKLSPYYRLDRQTTYRPALYPSGFDSAGKPIIIRGPKSEKIEYSVGSSVEDSKNWGHTSGLAVSATIGAEVGFLGTGVEISATVEASYEINVNQSLTTTASKEWTSSVTYTAEQGETIYIYQLEHEFNLYNSSNQLVKGSKCVMKANGDRPIVSPRPDPTDKANLQGNWKENEISNTFQIVTRTNGDGTYFVAMVTPARRARKGYSNQYRYTGTFDGFSVTADVTRMVFKDGKLVSSSMIHEGVEGEVDDKLNSITWDHGPHWRKTNK